MEYIEGGTLEDRIKEGPFSLEEAIRIASEAADGLKMAHEKNIVHRDVKSANLMLTGEGRVKILDFGLAKTAQSTMLTRMGSTLGTVAYMSPEQARGEEVDHRSDIWALGIILYEMMSGRNPFGGDYEQAVVYSILNEDPDPLTAIRTGVPMEFEMVVNKCLRKEADQRYQSVSGLIADLKALQSSPSQSVRLSSIQPPKPSTSSTSKGITWPVAAAVGLIGLVLGIGLMWGLNSSGGDDESTRDVIRSNISLPDDIVFQGGSGYELGLELSAIDITADGRLLVFPAMVDGERVLAIRDMIAGDIQTLEGTTDAFSPRFSPDDNWIVYSAANELYRIPVDGGRPRFITSISNPTGLAWLPDGLIYMADVQGGVLKRVSEDGDVEILIGEERCNCGLPTLGPGGKGVVVSGRDEERVLWWTEEEGLRELDISGHHITFVKDDQVVFANTGLLMAAPFDPETGRTGEEHVVIDDLRTGSIVRSGHYAITDDGTLVYIAGEPSGLADVVIRDGDGRDQPIGLPPAEYGPVSMSPDERYLIIRNYNRGGQERVFDLRTGSDQPLPMEADAAIWNHDGSAIIGSRQANDEAPTQFVQFDLASSNERELFELDLPAYISATSPDGRFVAITSLNDNSQELIIRELETGEELRIAQDEEASYWAGDWSRDGRFFSYTRVGEGGSQVFVEPFPFDGSWRRLTPDHGEEAEMLPDEDALVYRNGGSWYKVTYGQTLDSFSDPQYLFEGPYINVAGMEFRVLRNGRFVFLRSQNPDVELSRFEVVSGFDRLIDEALGE